MTAVHLDTHVVVWLAAGEAGRIPEHTRTLISESTVLISPMVRLELQLLHEKGRVSVGPDALLEPLVQALGLREASTPFSAVIAAALREDRKWPHRDPFDRIIAAGAFADGAHLITKDRRLRECFPEQTRWE